jgi:hypothetical protein
MSNMATKNRKNQLRWTKKIIKSFDGAPFGANDIVACWSEIGSPRYQPANREVPYLLKALEREGFLERLEPTKDTTLLGGTFERMAWREVKLDG